MSAALAGAFLRLAAGGYGPHTRRADSDQDPKVAAAVALFAEYAPVGPKYYLERLANEYGWSSADLDGNTIAKPPAWTRPDRTVDPPTCYVRRSLLRPHPPFTGAGDADAATFCNEIADLMVTKFGISRNEAVERINQRWSGDGGVWIVGLDIAYHEDSDHWASDIYYGHESCWWLPDAEPTPLPPPH
jgi:hypothetical protein